MGLLDLFNLERKGPAKVKFEKDCDEVGSFTFHIALFVIGLLDYFFVAFVGMTWKWRLLITPVFLYCVAQQIFALGTVSRMDPGYVRGVESGPEPGEEIEKVESGATGNETNAVHEEGQPEASASHATEQAAPTVDTAYEPREERSERDDDVERYCQKCGQMKPARAHHCRICNRCVMRYDHHCPFVMNCIGEKNYPYFFKFCMYATLSSFISLVCSCAEMITGRTALFYVDDAYSPLQALFVVPLVFSFIGLMFPCMIFFSQCGNVCEGDTIVEQKLGEHHGSACCRNFRDFLGRNWGLWLLKIAKR